MRTPALVSEATGVGTRIKSRVCLMYLDGVADESSLREVKRRLAERRWSDGGRQRRTQDTSETAWSGRTRSQNDAG